MKFALIPRILGSGLFGALGVGVLMGSLAPAAQAQLVYPGTDYLVTPSGGATFYYKLPGGEILPLSFTGLPIGSPTTNGALFSPTAPPTGGVASSPTPPNPDGSYGGYIAPLTYDPLTKGKADTVVNRIATVDPTATNINPITGLPDIGGPTSIEIIGLSLKGGSITLPAGLPGVTPGTYNIFAGLQKFYGNTTGSGPSSTGTMFIGDDPVAGKTWDSKFMLKAMGLEFL